MGNKWGCLSLSGVVLGPGLVMSFALHRFVWAMLLPITTIVILLCIAALPIGRKVTLANYADELERHLLGTDNDDEWDRTSSVRLSDGRLEHLRRSLPNSFDDLASEEDRSELRRIIETLRRGEIPNVGPRF